jgi:hypothetical protein
MATFSFTRLSSGTVKVVTADDTYFIPGDCKVDPNNTLNRIVITDRYGAKITMDSATDTINIAGVQNTGTATEIAEDLATDIFFLASSGGAAAWGDLTGTLSDQTDLQTALDAKSAHGITLNVSTPYIGSPADATSYYFGSCQGTSADTNAGRGKYYIPVTGTIRSVYIYMRSSTLASAETSTMYLRLNDTTDNTIVSTIANNATNTSYSNTALNISVTAGDFFEMKWTTPTWATNPTNVAFGMVVYIN